MKVFVFLQYKVEDLIYHINQILRYFDNDDECFNVSWLKILSILFPSFAFWYMRYRTVRTNSGETLCHLNILLMSYWNCLFVFAVLIVADLFKDMDTLVGVTFG